MANTFVKDLAFGKLGEEAVLQKLRVKYPCSVIIPGYFKGYDIWIPEIHKSVEVKYQRKNDKYDSYIVEIEANGIPSALSTTAADYWVFYDGADFVWTTPETIRECVAKYNIKSSYFSQDAGGKRAYFIKKKLLKEFNNTTN